MIENGIEEMDLHLFTNDPEPFIIMVFLICLY